MGKSDLLKNGMKSGLDGLLSSTGKSAQKKEPAPVKTGKEIDGYKITKADLQFNAANVIRVVARTM